jgi:N-formylglutamate amidohydrolase
LIVQNGFSEVFIILHCTHAKVMKNPIPQVLILFFVSFTLKAQHTAGQIYYGSKQYVEYWAGDLPLIISVPHGGSLEPTEIPNRTCATCTTVKDANTRELGIALHAAIKNAFGCAPHLIISNLHRKKLDPNREIAEAAQAIPAAELAWREFHEFINAAKKAVSDQHQRGLLIDLHGHGHAIQRLEIGYLLDTLDLRLSDVSLSAPQQVNSSSIRRLVGDNRGRLKMAQLIRGPYALGSLLAEANYPSVPSAAMWSPSLGEPYFNGGYITRIHGSQDNSAIDALQIEANFTGVRDLASNRSNFAVELASALKTYLTQHYFAKVACKTVSTSAVNHANYQVFPNPAESEVTLQATTAIRKVQLFNALGQIVFTSGNTATQVQRIDLSTQPKGLYVVSFELAGKVIKEKVVKQ